MWGCSPGLCGPFLALCAAGLARGAGPCCVGSSAGLPAPRPRRAGWGARQEGLSGLPKLRLTQASSTLCLSLFSFISVPVQFSHVSDVESYRVFNTSDNMYFTPEQKKRRGGGCLDWYGLDFFKSKINIAYAVNKHLIVLDLTCMKKHSAQELKK